MRIAMMGTGTFAEPTFKALLAANRNVVGLVTQPEREAGTKRASTRQTGEGMAAIAARAGVPVVQPASINAPDGLAALAGLRPELLVVAAYGQILSKAVIALPPAGAINVHASLLPKYRGAAPVAHAILGGEAVTGATIIRITPGLDAGDMLAQETLAIGDDETAGALETRLAPIGARLAVDVIQKLLAGPVLGTKQDPALVTKAPKLAKEMGLVRWDQPAANVGFQVRAMQPWPTAYTFLHRPGKPPMRVILGVARATAEPGSSPGTPTSRAGRLFVSAADALVELVELQPAGKARMTAAEFLRGYPILPSFRFGPEVLS